MKPSISFIIIVQILFSGVIFGQNIEQSNTVFNQAEAIQLRDPKASMTGYREPGNDVFFISLDDIGKYTGHVCAGIASAYLLIQGALQVLYPENELPVRGEISMTVSGYNDITEVAAYIIRARQYEGDEKEKNSFSIDTTISANPKNVVLVFTRSDTGKSVKAIFDKSKMAEPAFLKQIISLKDKVMNGTATVDEQKQFAQKVQNLTKKVITDTPDGLITIVE